MDFHDLKKKLLRYTTAQMWYVGGGKNKELVLD